MALDPSFLGLAERFMAFVYRETGFPIIVCDHNGVIVRAIDRNRIGDTHAGAQRILAREVEEAAVTPEEAARNPMVKEGYSCPIEIEGRRVATFGITGKLALAKPLARVAAMVLASWLREHQQQESMHRTAETVFSNVDALKAKIAHVTQSFNDLASKMGGAAGLAADKLAVIDKVLGTIHRISQQSHILSLNASVEAARAGEHGNAFSVVADEMKALAAGARTQAAGMQSELDEIKSALGSVSEAVEKSSALFSEHQRIMEEITDLFADLQGTIERLAATCRGMG